MGGGLAQYFREEFGAAPPEAEALASLAVEALGAIHGGTIAEDREEDLVARLQGPWALGHLAGTALHHPGVTDGVRIRLVERAFDIIPLPEDHEVFPLEGRVPGHLQDLVHFLLDRDQFNALHLLHLLYALFLRPDQATEGSADAVEGNLRAILSAPEFGAEEKALVALLEATARRADGGRLLRVLLTEPTLPEAARRRFATACLPGGRLPDLMVSLARAQGLLPSTGWQPRVPSLDVNPSRGMAMAARAWLEHR